MVYYDGVTACMLASDVGLWLLQELGSPVSNPLSIPQQKSVDTSS